MTKGISAPERVERWGIYEIAFPGHTEGNSFKDYIFQGQFSGKNESATVDGFYFAYEDGTPYYPVGTTCPYEGTPCAFQWDEAAATVEGAADDGYYLIYYGFFHPYSRWLRFDDVHSYWVELIDTRELTVNGMGVFKGIFTVPMPGKEYMAMRVTRVDGDWRVCPGWLAVRLVKSRG